MAGSQVLGPVGSAGFIFRKTPVLLSRLAAPFCIIPLPSSVGTIASSLSCHCFVLLLCSILAVMIRVEWYFVLPMCISLIACGVEHLLCAS